MKKIYCLLLTVCLSYSVLWGQTVPEISTEGNDIWYYIQFKRGNTVLQDMGDNVDVKTKDARKNADDQLWKITGTAGNYVLSNKSGRILTFGGSLYKTTLNSSTSFKLLRTANSEFAPAWELQRNGASGCVNQHGGYGADRSIGEWTTGDPNNPLVFVKPAEMGFFPEVLKEAQLTGKASAPTESKLTLWYRTPAVEWMTSALPIGNGQFGAMIFGGVRQEQIQFNDKTLWTGHTTKYGAYQNFGNLFINSEAITEASDYRRELDIENAIAKVSFYVDGVEYIREYFSSYPDSAVVVRLTASEPGKIDVNLALWNPHGAMPVYATDGASYVGKLDLVSFYLGMGIKNDGGVVNTSSEGIKVEGANSLTIVLRGKTNYNPESSTYISDAIKIQPEVEGLISDALSKSYDKLKEDHITDYKALFERVRFNLDGTINNIPTNELIKSYNSLGYKNLFLEELYFHYGRYLMIGSARGIDLPSNLQGIWNHRNDPPWNSDIHSNINVQMNYWPAENTNLSELHKTFLNYIYNEAIVHNQWKQNAKDAGQTKGWTLYTENNIFGYHGGFMHNYVIANAWYCMHMWQHYRYTLDESFLKSTAFPVMKTCVDFWMERLIKDRKVLDNTWVCPDEYSPEHGPSKEDATAHSQQLVWDLFNNTLQAIDILGEDVVEADFLEELKEKFEGLDKGLAIEASTGQLREWKYSPNSVGEATHRHMSHLMGLYPGNQISPLIDKKIFNAAVKSLTDRGDQSTGWSMGWKINLWARAMDGDHARKILNTALRLSTTTSTNQNDGGIYENLLDSHAPFQIDGNFGATAGITEMLLQSHMDTLQVLPALPSTWSSGNVKGICAIGGFEVDIEWKYGIARKITIKSKYGKECAVAYPGIRYAQVRHQDGTDIDVTAIGDDRIYFDTDKGGVYIVDFESITDPVVVSASYKVGEGSVIAGNEITVERGNKVTLFASTTETGGSWLWAGPNSFGATTSEVTFDNIQPYDNGTYEVVYKTKDNKIGITSFLVNIPGESGPVNGDYFIVSNGRYCTNDVPASSPAKPYFLDLNGNVNQGWRIFKEDNDKYTIKSLRNERLIQSDASMTNVNEEYDPDKHSFDIFFDGNAYAIRNTSGAFLLVENNRLIASATAEAKDSFVFTLEGYLETSVDNVSKEKGFRLINNEGTLRVEGDDIMEVALYTLTGSQIVKSIQAPYVFFLPVSGCYIVAVTYADMARDLEKVVVK